MRAELRSDSRGHESPPPDSLGFLVTDLARLFRRAFQEHVAGTGLTLAQARALIQVARNPAVSQAELADRLEIKPITLARVIEQLMAAGLVDRQPDPRDRRAYRVCLTPSAEPFLRGVAQVGEQLREVILTGLDPQQSEAAVAALRVMRDNLGRQRAASLEP